MMKNGSFTAFSIDNILHGDISGSDKAEAPPHISAVEVSRNYDFASVSVMAETRGKRPRSDDDEECPEIRPPSPCSSASSSDNSVSGGASPNAPKKKKARTCFTDSQIDDMERMYNSQRYLAASERKQLARSLRLTDQQVKTWFQNRRMKEKREVHDSGHHHVSPTSQFTSGMSISGNFMGPPIAGLSPAYNAAMMTSYSGLRPASLSLAHPGVMTSPLGMLRPLTSMCGTMPGWSGSGFSPA